MWGAAPRLRRLLLFLLLILGVVTPAGASQGRSVAIPVPPIPQRIWGVEVNGGDVSWLKRTKGRELRVAGVNAVVVDRARVKRRGDLAAIRRAAAMARVAVLVVDSSHATSTVMAKRVKSPRNVKQQGLSHATSQRLVLLVGLQKGKFSGAGLKRMILSFVPGTSDLAVSLPAARRDRLPVLLSFLNALRTTDKVPPTQPTPLSVFPQATSMHLTWRASTDKSRVRYRVFVNKTPRPLVDTTSTSLTGLTCSTPYNIEVVAVDSSGNLSKPASASTSTRACVSVSGVDTTPPSVPLAPWVTGKTTSSLSLSWGVSSDNVAVTGYGAYRNGVLQGTTAATAYTFTGLACGTSYTLAVDAYDGAGNRSSSAAVSASTAACGTDSTPPTVPTNEHFTGSTQTSISLAWNASTDNVGVTGYRVYLDGSAVGTTASTSYTFTGLACGTSYTVSISAYDAAGNASNAALAAGRTSTAACPGDTTAPTVPGSLAISGTTQTAITLSWARSSDNVAVTGYGVYRNGSLLGSTASTSYNFTGLACGTSYTLAVDAVDGAGNRSASASLSGSTAPCGSSPGANLWMSTIPGGSCSRSAAATVFMQATSCSTAQGAFTACQAGDLIGVQAGTYGSQTVIGAKTSPGCVIDMSASGSRATFSSFSPVSSSGSATWLEVRNGNIPGGYAWNQTSPKQTPSHLTLRDIDTTSNSLMKGGSDIAIIGGSVHDWDAGNHAAALWFETDTSSETMPNITVQGVTFRNLTNSVAGNHMEIIRIDTGTSNVLIDGNRFYDNEESTSTIFITNVNSDPGDPHDITIQNNFFGTVPDAYFVIATQTPVIQTCLNIAILYNTFSTSPTTMSGCTTKVNTRIVGNVGPRGSGCESGASYSHNVWQYTSNSPCGASDKVVVGSSGTQLLGLTNPLLGDMHLTVGSPAIGAGDPASYPAADYDGQARPTTPDAGADQH